MKSWMVAAALLQAESRTDYQFAIRCLKEAIGEDVCPDPIVMDGSEALHGVLRQEYPESQGVLCQWHLRTYPPSEGHAVCVSVAPIAATHCGHAAAGRPVLCRGIDKAATDWCTGAGGEAIPSAVPPCSHTAHRGRFCARMGCGWWFCSRQPSSGTAATPTPGADRATGAVLGQESEAVGVGMDPWSIHCVDARHPACRRCCMVRSKRKRVGW